jgi:hypothetical protein
LIYEKCRIIGQTKRRGHKRNGEAGHLNLPIQGKEPFMKKLYKEDYCHKNIPMWSVFSLTVK